MTDSNSAEKSFSRVHFNSGEGLKILDFGFELHESFNFEIFDS